MSSRMTNARFSNQTCGATVVSTLCGMGFSDGRGQGTTDVVVGLESAAASMNSSSTTPVD